MYYFGDYSQTLYKCKKYQNDESLLKHKQELERIMVEAETRNLPIPPGICAELGYLHFKANNPKEAVSLFQKEYQLYPEAKHLMERLIKSVELRENTPSNDKATSTENPSKQDS